jgi:hypothetical protein
MQTFKKTLLDGWKILHLETVVAAAWTSFQADGNGKLNRSLINCFNFLLVI